jgi:hypothetical protein
MGILGVAQIPMPAIMMLVQQWMMAVVHTLKVRVIVMEIR